MRTTFNGFLIFALVGLTANGVGANEWPVCETLPSSSQEGVERIVIGGKTLFLYRTSQAFIEKRLPARTKQLLEAVARNQAIEAFRGEFQKVTPSPYKQAVLRVSGMQNMVRSCSGQVTFFYWVAIENLRWLRNDGDAGAAASEYESITNIKSNDALIQKILVD